MLKHKIALIIGGVIVIAIAAGGIAFASTTNSNDTQNTSSTASVVKPAPNTQTSNTTTVKPNNTTNGTTIPISNTTNSTKDSTSNTTQTNNQSSNTQSVPKQNSNTQPSTPQSSTNQAPTPPNNTPSKSSSTNGDSIKIVNYSSSQIIEPNDIMVENTTGKPIPNSQLLAVIKNWILNQQYSYRGFADCNGTMWSAPWLNNIPSNQLISYFTEANGEAALSQNITAQELNKTTVASLAFAKAHPNPFSQAQTDIYIKQMLQKSYPNQTITNIVFHGNNSQGGDYYVYTKQMGTSTPFWYVESWIGYPTGV
ncbi:MAG: hypothetical protein ACRC57_10705 [Sarcina sp.]